MYFAESILVEGFIGVNCVEGYEELSGYRCKHINETGSMGGDVWSPDLRGVYFVRTNEKSPFARELSASDLGCINNDEILKTMNSAISSLAELSMNRNDPYIGFMTKYFKIQVNDFYYDQRIGSEC